MSIENETSKQVETAGRVRWAHSEGASRRWTPNLRREVHPWLHSASPARLSEYSI